MDTYENHLHRRNRLAFVLLGVLSMPIVFFLMTKLNDPGWILLYFGFVMLCEAIGLLLYALRNR